MVVIETYQKYCDASAELEALVQKPDKTDEEWNRQAELLDAVTDFERTYRGRDFEEKEIS